MEYPHLSDPSLEHCVLINANGLKYVEFTCLYPTYGKTYFPFELSYDPVPMRDWMRDRLWIPLLSCVLYGIFIVVGRAYFETRPAWNFRKTLALWNLGLSIFSTWGLVRTAPYVLHNLFTHTWRDNWCVDPESNVGGGSSGLWAQMFVLSKIPELLDTFFIVIHKKPLLFLHWYHHITVLLFTWYAYVNNAPIGVYFIAMNYAVHAMMYFYYFLMAVHMKPKWFNPVWITVAQISQMFAGVLVTAMYSYLLFVEKPEGCLLKEEVNHSAMLMYGSYLVLFVQFFFERYAIRGNKKVRAAKKLD